MVLFHHRLRAFAKEKANYDEILSRHSQELLKKRGPIFGTPLNALTLDQLLTPGEAKIRRIRFLIEAGAELDPAERRPEDLELLYR